MTKRFYKHKLLYDENMPKRKTLPRVNEHYDVRHIRDDLKLGGIDDPGVYETGLSQGRIIVTHNWTDFLGLAGSKDDLGVIGIPTGWAEEKIDTKLLAFLRKKSSSSLRGKVTNLGAEESKRVIKKS